MKNYRIDYYSMLYTLFEGVQGTCDIHLANADDGEPCNTADAKEQMLGDLDNIINEVQEFKSDIKKLSLKKAWQKYE